MVDLTLLFSAGCFALLLALLVYLRVEIPRSIAKFKQDSIKDVQQLFFNWAFVVTEEDVEGQMRKVARASPALVDLLNQVMPVVMIKGIEWAKANVKLPTIAQAALGVGAPAGPAGEGISLPAGSLKFVPKEYRGLAEAFLPGILAKFFAGPQKTPEPAGPKNPFLSEAK